MTIPSQIRYVLYTEQVVHSAGLTFLTAPERRLVHVIMYTIPAFDSTGGCSEGAWLGVGPPCDVGLGSPPLPTADPFFRIICNGDELFTSRVSPGDGEGEGQ